MARGNKSLATRKAEFQAMRAKGMKRLKQLNSTDINLYLPGLEYALPDTIGLRELNKKAKSLSKREYNKQLSDLTKDWEFFLKNTADIKSFDPKALDKQELGMLNFLVNQGIVVTSPKAIENWSYIYADVMAVARDQGLGSPEANDLFRAMNINVEDYSNLDRRRVTKAQLIELLNEYKTSTINLKDVEQKFKRNTKQALEELKKFKSMHSIIEEVF